MKKIVFIFLIIFSLNVYAVTCDNNEFKRLKNLAEKVEFTYDYEIEKIKQEDGNIFNKYNFSITANNLNEDLKVLIIYDKYSSNKEFKYNSDKKNTIKGFFEGDKVNITIEAYTTNDCSGKVIMTKTVNIPYYNRNYDKDFCIENPSFKYCKEFTEKYISSSEYGSEMEKFFDNNQIDVKEEIKKQDNNYLIYAIITFLAIFIFLLLIVYIVKRQRKNSL